jgi:acetyltransferase-like isoleucine patch superfamily enzyme
MKHAPIVLFVYNRPGHTRRMLDALSENPEAMDSVLYIYADGPPVNATKELVGRLDEVRRIIREKKWCGEVHIRESEANRGLADSIVGGVTEVIEEHGRVIVLEDDIVTSRGFLSYMNCALELYKEDAAVMQISAYAYPVGPRPDAESYFLKTMSCWGWATWRRAWKCYEPSAAKLLAYWTRDSETGNRFNLDGSGDYIDQLRANADGRKRTWAVKWFASWMATGGLCLYPRTSLAHNIGHDDTGENCATTDVFAGPVTEDLGITRVACLEEKRMRAALAAFYRKHVTSYREYPSTARIVIKRVSNMLGLGFLRRIGWSCLKKFHPNLKLLEREGFRYHYDAFKLDSEISDQAKISFPYHVESCLIGRYTYVSQNSWINRTKIGSFCSIGPNFCCGWGTHPLDGISTSPTFYSTRKQNGASFCDRDQVPEFDPIEIGNDVYIGMNVTVLDGVRIGDGAVIGAGAVVSKDIPPYAIAVGCPIRIVRYRFDPDTIARLLKVQWWTWPDRDLPLIAGSFFDVEKFLGKVCPDGNDSIPDQSASGFSAL